VGVAQRLERSLGQMLITARARAAVAASWQLGQDLEMAALVAEHVMPMRLLCKPLGAQLAQRILTASVAA
jgi:hypothetical protein